MHVGFAHLRDTLKNLEDKLEQGSLIKSPTDKNSDYYDREKRDSKRFFYDNNFKIVIEMKGRDHRVEIKDIEKIREDLKF